MVRSQWVGLLLLIAYLGNYFASGQSTNGDCNNSEQDFQKYFSDALVLLTRTIQLEFQNLKVQNGEHGDKERTPQGMPKSVQVN